MMILSIIWYAIVAIVAVMILFCIIVGYKLIAKFEFRHCKYCKHTMEYKGFRDDDNNGHYLFHCEHCGAWEQVPKEELIGNCNLDCSPERT